MRIDSLVMFSGYLVGGSTPLKNMKVSWDDDIPNIWKNIQNVPNHQPDDIMRLFLRDILLGIFEVTELGSQKYENQLRIIISAGEINMKLPSAGLGFPRGCLRDHLDG